MNITGKILMIAALGVLSACGTFTPVSRDAVSGSNLVRAAAPQEMRDWRVVGVEVEVPRDLKVSEANSYFPIADIVWRGDPPGDRYAQVADLLRGALAEGTRHLQGDRPVVLRARVSRFHSLTEKTRYTFGGSHSIHYRLSVHDADSGAVLYGPRRVDASLDAWGGQRALEAEARGETQKLRITRHVAGLTREGFAPDSGARLAAAE